MRNTIINRLLLLSIFALTIGSCDDKEETSSVITTFEKYATTTNFTPVTTNEEDEEHIIFKVALNDAQINDITLHVGVGSSSTAKEDVDFEIVEHDIPVAALAGQDSVAIEINILQDGIIEEDLETIYLTFTTTGASGLTQPEMLVAKIVDSGIRPVMEIALNWDQPQQFQGESFHLGDSVDLDFYLVDENDDIVDAAATGAYPEAFELPGNIPDGVYTLYVHFAWRVAFENTMCTDAFGNDFPCLGPFPIPLNITFTRNGKEQVINYPVLSTTNSGLWYYVGDDEYPANEENFIAIATIKAEDGIYTISDVNDDEIGVLARRKTFNLKGLPRKK